MTEFSQLFQKILQEKQDYDSNEDENLKFQVDEKANVKFLSNLIKTFEVVDDNEKNAEFILALKPLLSEQLQLKADEAIKMLKIFSVISNLKEDGILN